MRHLKYLMTIAMLAFCIKSMASLSQGKEENAGWRVTYSPKSCMVEIPDTLLERDFILTARIEKTAKFSGRLRLSSGQRLYDPMLVSLKVENDKLLIYHTEEHLKNAEGNWAYIRNNLTSPIYSLKIKERKAHSLIVDFSTIWLSPIKGVDPYCGKTLPGRLDPSGTAITHSYTTPSSIEVSVRYVYDRDNEKAEATVRKALVVLPRQPMTARIHDERINYDYVTYKELDTASGNIMTKKYLTRFRIDPSVPIVFYVDSCFPPLWKNAIKQGIEDWNRGFRQIGLGTPLLAKDYPKEKTFDEFASGINCVRYVISDFPNAMGKHWCDPRSGEILEADVLFYSSVKGLLQKWYFLQTAASNPNARGKVLSDSILHRIIRYAAAHEIGHCLGLDHNFKASSAYETEDLRKKRFTDRMGSTPSIMDYARFNYVAQPGDNVQNIYPPLLGEYDIYALEMGYKPMKTESDTEFTRWIDVKQKERLYLYDKANPSVVPIDPTVMQTDIGNNPRLSAVYGMKNLKYILSHLPEWNSGCANPFDGMPASFQDLREYYFSHIERVVPWIGGIYKTGTADKSLPKQKEYVSAQESEASIRLIMEELSAGCSFLMSKEVQKYAEAQIPQIIGHQKKILDLMFHDSMWERLAQSAEKTGFGIEEYLQTMGECLFLQDTPGCLIQPLRIYYLQKIKELGLHPDKGWFSFMLAPALHRHRIWIDKQLNEKNMMNNDYLKTIIK